jgi:hypothetical protein
MDRLTWAFVGGAVALCVLAIASVFLVRTAAPPPLTTPQGVVAAYVQAVRDRDADRAWDLLASGAAVGPAPPVASNANVTSRDVFRRQMSSLSQNAAAASRIRIASSTTSGDSARVTIEISTSTGGPALFGGDYSRTLTFGLKRVNDVWKIDTAPGLYELG